MPSLLAILTEATCGFSCWHAKEEICHCSCGGKNHGCMKTGDREQPTRTARIDGKMYELVAVGTHNELYVPADKLANAFGFSAILPYGNSLAHYTWRATDKK